MEKKKNNNQEPVSMYTLFARMFAHIAKEVTDRFGEEGAEAVKAGVWAFGQERGRNIAERALKGCGKASAHEYLPYYDMGRDDDFTNDDIYGDQQVEQVFKQCVFADQWMQDGTEKYGALYCEMIDPAIATGYNENMECIHEKHIFDSGVCTFCFRLKDEYVKKEDLAKAQK